MITLSKISKKNKQLPLSIKLSADSCIILRRLIHHLELYSDDYNDCITTSLLKELELINEFSSQMEIEFEADKLYAFDYSTDTALLIITNHQAIIEAIHKVNTDSES